MRSSTVAHKMYFVIFFFFWHFSSNQIRLNGCGARYGILCGTITIRNPASFAISIAVSSVGTLSPVTVPLSARRHSAVCREQIFFSVID